MKIPYIAKITLKELFIAGPSKKKRGRIEKMPINK
jgi:hypothetical protein